MSQELFQLQNNEILISKDNKTYADTLSNFKLDYAACPTFANTFIMYNRSLLQYVLDSTIQTYAAQKDFDTIIDDIDSIINAQTLRNTPAPTFTSVQTTALSAVDSAASAAYTAGFTSSANGTAMIYDSDSFTQAEIQTTAALAAASPANFATQFPDGFPIRARATLTAGKSEIHLTALQVIQLDSDWIVRYKAIKSQVWSLQEQINSAATANAVQAITISIT
ncbi:hypothetical protein [Pectinatus frisingensis]|uniref:hypothetical protein n=1 Tax=Pectinatus frisingensis TaxID=865 RepID=UPI0018C5BC1A|nr:hypothetical protein [Pectinatus frisingensis]